MREIKFAVSGNPVGKERPRRGKYGNFYTPKKTHDAEARIYMEFWLMAIQWAAMHGRKRSVLPEIQRAERVKIDIKCFFASKRHADLDNIQKLVWDALGDRHGERLGDDKRFYGSIDFEFWKAAGMDITISW
jgi:Holliday junction resolvase RusA-like endonuclease